MNTYSRLKGVAQLELLQLFASASATSRVSQTTPPTVNNETESKIGNFYCCPFVRCGSRPVTQQHNYWRIGHYIIINA